MPYVTLYRLEFEDGYGPYTSSAPSYDQSIRERINDAHWSSTHPSGSQDGISQWTHTFAFRTMEQLDEWFGEWVDILLEAGARLISVTVDEEYVTDGKSGKQVGFLNKAEVTREVLVFQ